MTKQNFTEKSLRANLLPLFIKQSRIREQYKNQQEDRSNNVEGFEWADSDVHCFSFANLTLDKNETSAVASPANVSSGLTTLARENKGATTEATNTSPRFPTISDIRSTCESVSAITSYHNQLYGFCQMGNIKTAVNGCTRIGYLDSPSARDMHTQYYAIMRKSA